MSLYNALFGMNPLTPILKAMLNLDTEDGYDTGRFRDIYIQKPEKEGDEPKIVLYTRNGGGNREEYQPTMDRLAEHPNYITDYDDDFDCTYASVEFSVPEKFKAFVADAINAGAAPDQKPMERFQGMIGKLQAGADEKDPDVKRALEVGRGIFSKLEEKFKQGGGTVEV